MIGPPLKNLAASLAGAARQAAESIYSRKGDGDQSEHPRGLVQALLVRRRSIIVKAKAARSFRVSEVSKSPSAF